MSVSQYQQCFESVLQKPVSGNLVSCRQTVDVVPSKRLKLTLSITDVEARRGEKLTPC